MELNYRVVDVFSRVPLEGNPLAVFTAANELDGETMQRIAKELNLAETAFLLPATREGCDVRVRIFTPAKEMIFAGHPTIGSAFVALTEKLVARERPEFVLQEEVGPVRVRTEGDEPLIWLTTPPVSRKGALERGACARAVGLSENDLLGDVPCEIWTAGNPNLYLAVRDKEAVDRASADTAALRELYASQPEPVCTYVFAKAGDGTYSRMFAPQLGVPEDPATGSAAGPLAAFMMAHGLCPHAGGTQFINEQGTKMGRRSLLHVRINGERGADGIEVGGYVSPIVRATMTL